MICTNCGSNVDDDSIFCNVCGAKIKRDVTENAAPEQNYTQEQYVAPEQNYTQEQYVAPEQNYTQGQYITPEQSYVTNNYQQIPPQKPAKKKGVGKILGIAGGVVVLAAVATAGVLTATGRMGNFIHKNFTSPESYFKYVAEKNMEESVDAFSAGYAKSLEYLNLSALSNKGLSLKMEAGSELKPLLGMVDESLKKIDNAAVFVNASKDDSVQNIELKANINDADIVTLKASVDLENEEGYLQVPELNDSYIDISDYLEEINEELESSDEYEEMLDMVQEGMPNAATVSKILNSYAGVAIDNITEAKKSTKTIKAEGISQKVTVLETTLDGKYAYETMISLCEMLEDDEEIEEIIQSIDESAYEEFADSVKDFKKEIKDSKDEMKNSETEVEMKLYVNGKGEIVGTSISVEDYDEVEISVLMPEKNSKFGYEMVMKAEGEKAFEITGSGDLKGNVMNGEFSVSLSSYLLAGAEEYVSDGKDILQLKVKDFNVEKAKKGEINGTFTFSSDAISELEGYQLEVDLSTNNNEVAAEITVRSEGSEWAKITLNTGESETLETLEPSDDDMVYKISELDQYISEIDLEEVLEEALEKADIGLDEQDIIDMLKDALGMSDDYDYGYYGDYGYDDYDYDYNYNWGW